MGLDTIFWGSVKGENETNTDTQNQNQEVGGRQEPSKESEGNRGRAKGYYNILNVKDKKNMTENSVKDKRSQDEHRNKALLDFTVHSAIISNSWEVFSVLR